MYALFLVTSESIIYPGLFREQTQSSFGVYKLKYIDDNTVFKVIKIMWVFQMKRGPKVNVAIFSQQLFKLSS